MSIPKISPHAFRRANERYGFSCDDFVALCEILFRNSSVKSFYKSGMVCARRKQNKLYIKIRCSDKKHPIIIPVIICGDTNTIVTVLPNKADELYKQYKKFVQKSFHTFGIKGLYIPFPEYKKLFNMDMSEYKISRHQLKMSVDAIKDGERAKITVLFHVRFNADGKTLRLVTRASI